MFSLRGRRLKGKGKGVLGARETRGAFSVFSLHRRSDLALESEGIYYIEYCATAYESLWEKTR